MPRKLTFVCLILLLFAAVACRDDREVAEGSATPAAGASATATASPMPSATPAPTSTPSPSPTPDLPDPRVLLDGALAELDRARNFRVEMEVGFNFFGDESASPESVRDVTFQPPNRTSGVTHWDWDGDEHSVQHVIIDDDVYLALPESDVWERGGDFFPAPSQELWRQDVVALKYVEETTVGSVTVHHVRGQRAAADSTLLHSLGDSYMLELVREGRATAMGADVEIDFYIDVDSGRLIRMTEIGDMWWLTHNVVGEGETGEIGVGLNVDARFSDYDASVAISVPDNLLLDGPSFVTPHGDMTLFRWNEPPFNLAIPASWRSTSAGDFVTAEYEGPDGGLLAIAIEDLVDFGLGTLSLDEYVDLIARLLANNGEIEITSRVQLETRRGESAVIIKFSGLNGAFIGQRFIYVQDNRVGFNVTYLGTPERIDALRPLIEYSFNSFQVGAPPPSLSVWHGWGLSYLEEIETVFGEAGEAEALLIDLTLIAGQEVETPDLPAAVAAGAGPDILAWLMPDAREHIVPLTPWIDPASHRATYAPVAADATIRDGEVWGVPISQEGIAIVYNRELVDADQLPSDPADFDGLLAAARAYRAANPDRYLICNQGLGRTSEDAYHVAPIFFGFGGEDERGFIDADGNVFVDTPERLAAAEWLVQFAEVSPPTTSHTECLRGMADGTYAAWWTGPWAIADLEAAGIDYAILPFGRPVVGVKRLMMGVNALARENDAAVIELLRHFGSAEVQIRLSLANGTVPAHRDALAHPQVQARYSVVAFGEAIAGGVPESNHPYADLPWEPLGEMIRVIVAGEMAPADALAATQAELERLVAEAE